MVKGGSWSCPVRVGVSFRPHRTLYPRGVLDYVEYAQVAERCGFDDFDASEHILNDARPITDYPGGSFRWDDATAWPDPLIMLAACAAKTQSIGLTTSVLVVPLRPAVVVAKMMATLAELAPGRVRLGVGTGWNRPEFDAVGIPFVGRTKRLEDAVAAARRLWSGDVVDFSSDTVTFGMVRSRPAPPQPIPVLLGGPATEQAAERIARLGDGWTPMAAQSDELAAGIRLIHAAFARAERPLEELIIRTPVSESLVASALRTRDARGLRAEIERLSERGVTDVHLWVASALEGPEEVPDALGWLAENLGLSPTPSRADLAEGTVPVSTAESQTRIGLITGGER